MPPYLDIYGLTQRRDIDTINSFLDSYVDRATNEDRGDEELMLLPLELHKPVENLEDFDWEPARTLSNVIQRGLDCPRRSFSVYLNCKKLDYSQLILSFTTDNLLVLGLTVDDEGELPENKDHGEKLLKSWRQQYGCYFGLITVDQPPPSNEEEFLTMAENSLTLSFYRLSQNS